MNHPIFGSIEYSSSLPFWEGRVRVPFFSAYDTPVPWPVWNQEELKKQLQGGPFRPVHPGPSRHGTDRRPRASVRSFPGEPGRDLRGRRGRNRRILSETTSGLRPRLRRGRDEAFGPALENADDLKRLIQFRSLYVLEGRGEFGWDEPYARNLGQSDGLALLGFSFRCAWDDEHGLGVLYHRDKVVDVGSSDICWEGIGDF